LIDSLQRGGRVGANHRAKPGRQRQDSAQAAGEPAWLEHGIGNRVVVFDVHAAHQAAQLAAARKARGRPVDIRDTFIAGIAAVRGATLATRDTRHATPGTSTI